MTRYAFPVPAVPALPVAGTDEAYPVARIFCVGRNYAAHAREMGFDPTREEPFYFTKPASSLTLSGATVPYPPGTENYQHEMELVLALGAPIFRADADAALAAVWAYAAGLDMTRRDLQLAARDKGRPWDLGKSFEHSAVVGPLARAAAIGHPARGRIALTVNGAVRQDADLDQLIWGVGELVAHLSAYYHLGPGDLIFTGTPEGVAKVGPGDRLDGSIEGIGAVGLTIGPPE